MKIYQIYLFLTFIFVFKITSAQEMPLDFSNASDNFTSFSGSGFAFNTDPNDNTNPVGQFFNDGVNAWQGFTIDLASAIDLDFQNTISLSFYGFDPNAHNIVLKLENGVNADVEVLQNVPAGGGWTNDIIFDFSNAVLSSDATTPVNATGIYNKLTLFIDGGLTIPGTYLIDNIDDGSVEIIVPEPVFDTLVWSDEFDVTGAIDDLKWYQQTQLIAGDSWANGEQQHYTNSTVNSFVSNGTLKIVAKAETFTDQGITKQYTSARLNSIFAFKYGRVEVRAKLPSTAGTWPAIWLLGKNIDEDGGYWDNEGFGDTFWPWCGEIDIMEPNVPKNQILATWHWNNGSGYMYNSSSVNTTNTDTSTNFHLYSLVWTANSMKIYMDNILVNEMATFSPFQDEFYILLNVAMGGSLGGAIPNNFTQDEMEIDYVRVYQENALSTIDYVQEDIKVYPNPVTNLLNIELNHFDIKKGELQVFDVSGRKIANKTFRIDGDTLKFRTSSLQTGVYFIKLLLENGKTETIKFLKH